MKSYRLIAALLGVVFLLGCSGPELTLPEPQRETTQTPVGKAAFSSWVGDSFIVSYDSRRIGYIENVGDNQVVVLDGKKGREYDEIYRYWLEFSPDSQRLAYVVMEGDKRFVVVDGKEGKRYDDILILTPIFSPDSSKVAYAAKLDEKWFSVEEGEEGKPYDRIESMSYRFSPDGERIAYAAVQDDKWYAVVDGEEGEPYDRIDPAMPFFSRDSARVAYIAHEGENVVVVVDGVEGEQFDEIGLGTPIFSPDSRSIAYVARKGSEWFAVTDGVKSRAYDDIKPQTLMFSPDSRTIVYAASYDNGWYMVENGVEGKKYGYIYEDSPVISPDSQHLAYVACPFGQTTEGTSEIPQSDTGWFVVLDGEEGQHFLDIASSSLIFSPDSTRLAYTAQAHSGHAEEGEGGHSHEEDKWCVVVDGEKQEEYTATGAGTIVFSPDSQHIVYAATYNLENWFIVYDGVEQKLFEGVAASIVFSEDSKWIAYIGRIEDKSYVMVNASEGKPYDGVLISWGASLEFISADTLRYLAVDGDDFYLVEETIKEVVQED